MPRAHAVCPEETRINRLHRCDAKREPAGKGDEVYFMETGNGGKPRILSAIIDNLFAMIAAFSMVAIVRAEHPVANVAVLSLAYLGYYFIFESVWSRTPGKFFQGLEVRRLDGSPCGYKAATIRTILRILEVIRFYLGACRPG